MTLKCSTKRKIHIAFTLNHYCKEKLLRKIKIPMNVNIRNKSNLHAQIEKAVEVWIGKLATTFP